MRPKSWTDLTIRFIVIDPVLHRTHSIQLVLDSNLVVITQIFIKFFQEVLNRVELLQTYIKILDFYASGDKNQDRNTLSL